MAPKHAGALTELSRNMLMQSSPDVESLVRADFAAVLAETLDAAAIKGTGASNQPTGILSTTGIGDVAMGANGGALTADAVRDLIGKVADANADSGALAFLTNTKVKTAALKLKDAEGRYLGLDTVFPGAPAQFSNVVPSTLTKGTTAGTCSALLYGNWSDLLIGLWSEFDLLVNPYEATAYAKGNVQVRGMMTVDIAVRHAASFAAIKDITT
jgi:HK97 family phage major capsid protein